MQTQLRQGEPVSPVEYERLAYGALVDSGRERIRRLFMREIFCIREIEPDFTPDQGWELFTARALSTNSFENESQIATAWYYAFREPPRAHFRSIFLRSMAELRVNLFA